MRMTNISDFKKLEKIYNLYDETLKSLETRFACKEKCEACCTCNVVVTGLEGQYVLAALLSSDDEKAKTALKKNLASAVKQKHFIPQMTTNGFARMCIQNLPVPDEENDPAWGTCLLLSEGLCKVYSHRPFGCRAMVSQTSCAGSGEAQVPPLVLSVANCCMQAVEHLDQSGISGNLFDVLNLLLKDSGAEDPEALLTRSAAEPGSLFVANEKIPVFMIPPEHREQLSGFIQKLSEVLHPKSD